MSSLTAYLSESKKSIIGEVSGVINLHYVEKNLGQTQSLQQTNKKIDKWTDNMTFSGRSPQKLQDWKWSCPEICETSFSAL